ncbi:MAG: hypothetical protein NT023_03430 [Armatimonadetes bacterium]|nr:hypothetical protein [Armatimonadota bacterium]
MGQGILNETEVAKKGDSLYEQIRLTVETAENIGNIVSIDVETGDYEIDADVLQAGRRLQGRHPKVLIVAKRIGCVSLELRTGFHFGMRPRTTRQAVQQAPSLEAPHTGF